MSKMPPKLKKLLLIIDPQKDFMTSTAFAGSLSVPGADEDMKRLAQYIDTETPDSIVVTMDTHARMHIANPMYWVDAEGNHPGQYTLITVADVEGGKWKTSNPEKQEWALHYVKELAKTNKFTLCIWPYHCIEGTEGHEVSELLKPSLDAWEEKTGKKVVYIFKGRNPDTEMYSGLKAEVIIPEDIRTHLNQPLIDSFKPFDIIEVAGEAKSHCVASTAMDLIGALGQDAKKVALLENCMSSVPGFEKNGESFAVEATKLGCTLKNVSEVPIRKLKIA
jgi:nicotinamidase-related amidase